MKLCNNMVVDLPTEALDYAGQDLVAWYHGNGTA